MVMIRAGPYGRNSPMASMTAPIFFITVVSFSLQRQPAPLPGERRLVHLDAPLFRDQLVVGLVIALHALRVVLARLVGAHYASNHHNHADEGQARRLLRIQIGT